MLRKIIISYFGKFTLTLFLGIVCVCNMTSAQKVPESISAGAEIDLSQDELRDIVRSIMKMFYEAEIPPSIENSSNCQLYITELKAMNVSQDNIDTIIDIAGGTEPCTKEAAEFLAAFEQKIRINYYNK